MSGGKIPMASGTCYRHFNDTAAVLAASRAYYFRCTNPADRQIDMFSGTSDGPHATSRVNEHLVGDACHMTYSIRRVYAAALPKAPVEIFWRGRNGVECVLRSTDRGWEVAIIGNDGCPIRQRQVSSNENARKIAQRWQREEDPEDQ